MEPAALSTPDGEAFTEGAGARPRPAALRLALVPRSGLVHGVDLKILPPPGEKVTA